MKKRKKKKSNLFKRANLSHSGSAASYNLPLIRNGNRPKTFHTLKSRSHRLYRYSSSTSCIYCFSVQIGSTLSVYSHANSHSKYSGPFPRAFKPPHNHACLSGVYITNEDHGKNKTPVLENATYLLWE